MSIYFFKARRAFPHNTHLSVQFFKTLVPSLLVCLCVSHCVPACVFSMVVHISFRWQQSRTCSASSRKLTRKFFLPRFDTVRVFLTVAGGIFRRGNINILQVYMYTAVCISSQIFRFTRNARHPVGNNDVWLDVWLSPRFDTAMVFPAAEPEAFFDSDSCQTSFLVSQLSYRKPMQLSPLFAVGPISYRLMLPTYENHS